MKTKNNIDIRIVPSRQIRPLTSENIEVCFRPVNAFKSLKSFKQTLLAHDTRWNTKTEVQLETKAKALWSVEKRNAEKKQKKSQKQKHFKCAVVHFDAGGEYRLCLVPDEFLTINLKAELRKRLSDALKRSGRVTLRVDVREFLPDIQRKMISFISSLAVLTHWEMPQYGRRAEANKKKKNESKNLELLTDLNLADAETQIQTGVLLGESNNTVRTLANLPSNILRPSVYQLEIQKRAKNRGYSFEFIDRRALTRLKAGAFLAVVRGSPAEEAGIVHLTYIPKRKTKSKAHRVVLVGKGLCFDTGGLNLKIGNHMFGMHKDMTGSAVALTLFETLAALKVPYEVHALLALAENLVSPESFRPNDVVVALDGTSIEVVDTDAEGRMVLADTLALARRLKPELVIDFATLTGSAIRAIGTKRSAVFSNRPALLNLAVECGESSGERVWGFPIGDEYRDVLESETADLLQCATGAGPDHIHAATFLSHFVSDDIPWVHCDLSADSSKGGLGLVGTETTGFGLRWGLELVTKSLKI